MKTFKRLSGSRKAVLIIQSIAMVMGTSTHVMWAVHNGFLSENYHAPFGSMLFWDALTFLDPLAAVLLFARPKWGVWLTAIIIGADVLHNNWYYFDELYLAGWSISEWIVRYWMILGQVIFCVFVYITLAPNLKAIRRIKS